ncbi:MAG: hypothetical protein PHO80_03640 [Candidatus Gracilibacteria bacterium]|nr:hypothetical protein [Candidatus Gracilibacteria bacterium]
MDPEINSGGRTLAAKADLDCHDFFSKNLAMANNFLFLPPERKYSFPTIYFDV